MGFLTVKIPINYLFWHQFKKDILNISIHLLTDTPLLKKWIMSTAKVAYHYIVIVLV